MTRRGRRPGVPPWKVRSLRAQLGRWHPDQLAAPWCDWRRPTRPSRAACGRGTNLDAAQKLLALERLVLEWRPGRASPPTG